MKTRYVLAVATSALLLCCGDSSRGGTITLGTQVSGWVSTADPAIPNIANATSQPTGNAHADAWTGFTAAAATSYTVQLCPTYQGWDPMVVLVPGAGVTTTSSYWYCDNGASGSPDQCEFSGSYGLDAGAYTIYIVSRDGTPDDSKNRSYKFTVATTAPTACAAATAQ